LKTHEHEIQQPNLSTNWNQLQHLWKAAAAAALSHVGLGELFRVSTTAAQELGTKIKLVLQLIQTKVSSECHEPFSNNIVNRKTWRWKNLVSVKKRWRWSVYRRKVGKGNRKGRLVWRVCQEGEVRVSEGDQESTTELCFDYKRLLLSLGSEGS